MKEIDDQELELKMCAERTVRAIIHYKSSSPHIGGSEIVTGFAKLLNCLNSRMLICTVLMGILYRVNRKYRLSEEELNKILMGAELK